MGRPEKPVYPHQGPLPRFACELRQLRHRAGGRTYRELARRAHYSVTVLSDAARGERPPTLDVTLAYVRACDGDLDEWTRRWEDLQRQLAGPTEPTAAGGTRPAPLTRKRPVRRERALVTAVSTGVSLAAAVGVLVWTRGRRSAT